MNKRAIVVGIAAGAITLAWNNSVLLDWRSSNAPGNQAWWGSLSNTAGSVSKPEPKLWLDIKKTSVEETPDGGLDPHFDESVIASEGKRVELPGVGFLLSSGLRENERGEKEAVEFLLLPGNGGVAWCCGLTPIPKVEFSILVECPDAPFLATRTDPKSSAVFVNVSGVLRLQKENAISSLYTLEDASVEFIGIQDVVPPNVKNLCLNQPMAP